MNNSSHGPSLGPSLGHIRPRTCRWMSAFAVAALLLGTGTAHSQPTKADEPPAPDGSHAGEKPSPGASEPELRKRARELLVKGMDARKRELEAIEKALQLFDQGKSWEEIRTLVPELPRFGQRGEDRERWGGRQPGGEDVNRLGGPGGMPQGGGPGMAPPGMAPQGMPPSGKGSEGPRVLTEEDRETVREVLAAMASFTTTGVRRRSAGGRIARTGIVNGAAT